jgi:alpha-acetolactate decarboxylase
VRYNNYKIGKIKKFDGNLGEIISMEGIYYFTKKDIDNTNVEKNDLVAFNGKTEETFPQAYNVKKLKIKQTK